MVANLWVTNREQVRNALLVAKQTKVLVQTLKVQADPNRSSLQGMLDKWDAYSDLVIADYEFFLAAGENVPSVYRYQAEIHYADAHMHKIVHVMQSIFDIDVEPLLAQLVVEDVPVEEAPPEQVKEPVQTTLF
jgi:hypothetical protein